MRMIRSLSVPVMGTLLVLALSSGQAVVPAMASPAAASHSSPTLVGSLSTGEKVMGHVGQRFAAPALASASATAVFSCFVRHLGFWETVGIVAVAGLGALIIGLSAGVGTPFWIWLVGVVGGAPATILLDCVANPSS